VFFWCTALCAYCEGMSRMALTWFSKTLNLEILEVRGLRNNKK
jgi:hypothetical protein